MFTASVCTQHIHIHMSKQTEILKGKTGDNQHAAKENKKKTNNESQSMTLIIYSNDCIFKKNRYFLRHKNPL